MSRVAVSVGVAVAVVLFGRRRSVGGAGSSRGGFRAPVLSVGRRRPSVSQSVHPCGCPSVVPVHPCGCRPSRQAGGVSVVLSSCFPVSRVVVRPCGWSPSVASSGNGRGGCKSAFRFGVVRRCRCPSVVAVAVAGRGRSCPPCGVVGSRPSCRPVVLSVRPVVRVPPPVGSRIGRGLSLSVSCW